MLEAKYAMFCANIYSISKPNLQFEIINLSACFHKIWGQANRKECQLFVTRVCMNFLCQKIRGSFYRERVDLKWFSDLNDVQWTETFEFEFDCLEKMIFDLIKLFLKWCYYIISFYVLNIKIAKLDNLRNMFCRIFS